MPYFFCELNLSVGKIVSPAAEETRHLLLSHRVRVGETVKLQGPDKKRFFAEVVKAEKNLLELKCVQELPIPSEPKVGLVLFQAVIAEKALDFILQKGTELGLQKIMLFNAKNTAAKLSKEKFAGRKQRWEKILTGAAKQSERVVWPELEFVINNDLLKKQFEDCGRVYLTAINGGRPSPKADGGKIGIIVGPEGGFSEAEMLEFKALPNVRTLTLGPVLLRAETAALAAISGIRMVVGY